MEPCICKNIRTKIIKLAEEIHSYDLEYIYQGYFDPKVVMKTLSLIRSNLAQNRKTLKVQNKIYYILGESLQNITRHQEIEVDSADKESLFVLQKTEKSFYITTANQIKNENIGTLKEKIEKINKLDHDGLRLYSRKIKMTGKISEKGGAGLGLIEMAKRSGARLSYDFKKISDDRSLFYLNTFIDIYSRDNFNESSQNIKKRIENIKELHEYLLQNNIKLLFKGAFDQSNLVKLLSIYEKSTEKSNYTVKVFNIMMEILQNIVKHSDSINERLKPGIFVLCRDDNYHYLIAGNYIKKTQKNIIKNKIDYINSLNEEQLADLYNNILFDFTEKEDAMKTGLGFIDIKRRSGYKIWYDFININQEKTFYLIEIKV